MAGFIKLWRSDEFWQLVKDHPAFVLAAIIAVRARRTDGLDLHGLAVGETLLGDYREYGMTEGQYREAKKRLESMGFATFRTTNRGTIARLLFMGVFDPNLETEQRATQQTSNEPHNGLTTSHTTTNKDRRGKINEKEHLVASYSDDFSSWWSIYKKGSKAQAFTAWKKQSITADMVPAIILATKTYKAYCQSIDRPLKDGQGWLNGRFWETEWTHASQGTKPATAPAATQTPHKPTWEE